MDLRLVEEDGSEAGRETEQSEAESEVAAVPPHPAVSSVIRWLATAADLAISYLIILSFTITGLFRHAARHLLQPPV